MRLGEEVAAVDRGAFQKRAMPTLPFRRPVSLSPRLARVAANLARFRPGARVVDPFLGTGALALESAMVGAKITGVDHDARMIQGASRNFAALGLSAEKLIVGDSAAVAGQFADGRFDALVTDAPYGRASSSGGESPADLSTRVLAAWAPKIRPGGTIVTVTPGGTETVPAEWERESSIPDRVHRSLTREFRVYRRRP
jgi:tRNA (guanine10-N2)-dimethyltransferase